MKTINDIILKSVDNVLTHEDTQNEQMDDLNDAVLSIRKMIQ
jgi:hypothetical protein